MPARDQNQQRTGSRGGPERNPQARKPGGGQRAQERQRGQHVARQRSRESQRHGQHGNGGRADLQHRQVRRRPGRAAAGRDDDQGRAHDQNQAPAIQEIMAQRPQQVARTNELAGVAGRQGAHQGPVHQQPQEQNQAGNGRRQHRRQDPQRHPAREPGLRKTLHGARRQQQRRRQAKEVGALLGQHRQAGADHVRRHPPAQEQRPRHRHQRGHRPIALHQARLGEVRRAAQAQSHRDHRSERRYPKAPGDGVGRRQRRRHHDAGDRVEQLPRGAEESDEQRQQTGEQRRPQEVDVAVAVPIERVLGEEARLRDIAAQSIPVMGIMQGRPLEEQQGHRRHRPAPGPTPGPTKERRAAADSAGVCR